MSENEGRLDGSRCFVCGPRNPIGLQLAFRLDGDACVSEFTPGAHHCGYDGTTHGGIIFSALDDVMANWLYLKGIKAFTAKCDIRYRAPLPTGDTIALKGWCTKRKSRLVQMSSEAVLSGSGAVIATAEASFMLA